MRAASGVHSAAGLALKPKSSHLCMPLHSEHFTTLHDLTIKLSRRFDHRCFYLGQRKIQRTWVTSNFLVCGEVYLGLVWSGPCAVGSEPRAPYTLRKASSLSQVRSPPPSRVLGWGRGQGGVSATSAAAQEQGAAGPLPSPCWLELGAPASTPPQPPNTAASCLSGLLSQQD